MIKRVLIVVVCTTGVLVAVLRAAAPSAVTLIGKGVVAGTLLDLSGLTGQICQAGSPANCVPKAIFGGFGSDVAYTGHDNVFVAAPDRGPFDGLTDVPFLDRVHFLHITTDVGASFPNVTTRLLDTRLLKNEFGQTFVGAEGIRVGPNGSFYVSDEYGPYLFEFDRQGHLLQRIDVPAKFLIANPSADPNAELLGNWWAARATVAWRAWPSAPTAGRFSTPPSACRTTMPTRLPRRSRV